MRMHGSNALIVYRLNTYPFIHMGFFHASMNLLALTPLLERFEAEHGTLTAIALFIGRKSYPSLQKLGRGALTWSICVALSTFPAGLYILFEKFLLHRNTAVIGAR
jgi:surface polysaccharide O-acyltransferase-like enzyme